MADDESATDEEQETGGDDKGLGEPGKKALDAERKARRDAEKRARDIEAQLKDLEDKDKPEIERLTNKLAEAERQAAEASAKALRLEVALEKGLTKTQARRLVGDTEEDLAADADDLIASFRPPDDGDKGDGDRGASTRRPVEKLTSGATQDGESDEPDPKKIAESILSDSTF